MILKNFFIHHPVFTTSEFTEYLGREEKRNMSTRDNLLAYHVNKGHLQRVKQGLYVVLSSDMVTMDFSVDPYLLASRMAKDAVLSYHTALDFHSKSYSVYNQFLYLTEHSVRKVSYGNYIFLAVRPPKPLLDQNQSKFGVVSHERNGLKIEVTSLERTLVDLFDKPNLGGGWEEVWRSLESVEFYNINEVIEYALLLSNATTVAKVGFFLEKNQERFFVDKKDLQKLKKRIPRQPHYMDKKLKGKLVRQWNLIVPEKILEKSWGEVL
jgi:predicted transcriptional regulator of viral defense system